VRKGGIGSEGNAGSLFFQTQSKFSFHFSGNFFNLSDITVSWFNPRLVMIVNHNFPARHFSPQLGHHSYTMLFMIILEQKLIKG